jgi:hypothetical protein
MLLLFRAGLEPAPTMSPITEGASGQKNNPGLRRGFGYRDKKITPAFAGGYFFWLRGRDLNPRPQGYALLLQLSLPRSSHTIKFVVWTIPSPSPSLEIRSLPTSLYTFSECFRAWLGIAMTLCQRFHRI